MRCPCCNAVLADADVEAGRSSLLPDAETAGLLRRYWKVYGRGRYLPTRAQLEAFVADENDEKED